MNTANSTQAFALKQTSMLKNEFELFQEEQALATLRFTGLTSIKADLEVAQTQQHIIFKYEGISGKHVTATDGNTGALLAQLDQTWTGSHGKLTLYDGRELGWLKTSFWSSNFAFEDPEGQQFMRFTSKMGLAKLGAQADVNAVVLSQQDMILLVTFGLFMLIVSDEMLLAAAAIH